MIILAYGDSIRMQTGYGRVSQHIFAHWLKQGHQIVQIGWQHMEPPENVILYDEDGKQAGTVGLFPPHTRDEFAIKSVLTHIKGIKPDFVYAENDIFTCTDLIDQKKLISQDFKLVNYGVIDSPNAAENFRYTLEKIDVPVTPSQFGYKQTSRINPNAMYIPHGVSLKTYRPLVSDKEEMKARYNMKGRFVFGLVNRNVPRKLFPFVFRAIRDLKRKGINNITLFTIADPADIAGENLFDLAKRFDLKISWDLSPADVMLHPQNLNFLISIDESELAKVYNAMNVLVSTSIGEGFGLPTLEGAACGTPSIACDHSANTELISGHGWLYSPVKTSDGNTFYIPNMGHKFTAYDFPIPDYNELLKAMEDAYNNTEKLKDYSRKCIDFARAYDWYRILPKWDAVIEKVEELKGG
jgi:glycosyltransferase involved in cell wall biosynthesis